MAIAGVRSLPLVAYEDDELSVSDGEPAEFFEFIGPQRFYRYTSSPVDLVFEGNVYTAVPISRTSVMGQSAGNDTSLTVRMHADEQVAADYCRGNPPRSLGLRIYRRQSRSGLYEIIWDSVITAPRVTGRWAEFNSPSKMTNRLATTIPSVAFQRMCNHFLYDQHCRKIATDFDITTTVQSVNETAVGLGSIGGQVDDWFRAGRIRRNADGEHRLIVRQQAAALTLSSPFRVLQVGDSVTIFAGCDHTVRTCRDKFSNVVNFGGHPGIPRIDVFRVDLSQAGGS